MPDDLNELLKSIVIHPREDTPRLVYADCLEERAGERTCPKCGGNGRAVCPLCKGVGCVPDGKVTLTNMNGRDIDAMCQLMRERKPERLRAMMDGDWSNSVTVFFGALWPRVKVGISSGTPDPLDESWGALDL
jgi:uncharacterized protein (TIGR02996 family)